MAVLAVDPSSTRTGGSILGDKTRMARLAVDPNAFIRPSPSSGTLGGVAAKTRETMLLCEAAGFDVILVETVGIGQSETAVADMTDFFLVLMLPGAGDELQGIKKGVLELADMIAVNKAERRQASHAPRAAAAEYRAALHILGPARPNWSPPVLTISACPISGWTTLGKIMDIAPASPRQARSRPSAAGQQGRWMWTMIEERLLAQVHSDPKVRAKIPAIEAAVSAGTLSPTLAAEEILAIVGVQD